MCPEFLINGTIDTDATQGSTPEENTSYCKKYSILQTKLNSIKPIKKQVNYN